jgi:hypothetical protein
MGYIFLGHGWLEAQAGTIPAGMEIVAIPEGTTIQFYADSGQGLVYGSGELDIWEQLQAPWAPLDSTNVTYNLALGNAAELWADELQNDPGFGGHTLIRAGVDGVPDPILMCTGSPDTCPTDPRAVAAGATHTCDGILGTYSGDLYWLACTSFSGVSKDLETAALGGRSTDVVMGANPDWVPDDSDLDAIAAINRENVKATGDEESIDFVIGGWVMLIGDGHTEGYVDYASFQNDVARGSLTVNKGGAFSAGSLDVTGVPPAKQGVVEAAIARFSDKTVNFN